MEAELAALLTTGATTLTSAILTDAWATLRGRLGALFGRAQHPDSATLDELEELRGSLAAAHERGNGVGAAEAESRITALLHGRLRQLLLEQPFLIGEVRELISASDPTVNNGTLVMGAHAQVSNTYHYYGNPPAPQPVVSAERSPLPRITLQPMRHYQNNDDLLQRMDTIWSACRADGTPALMYLTGVPGIGTSALVRRWLQRHRHELTGPQLHARLGRDSAGNLPDTAAILERWFRELGVPPQDVPADPQDRSDYFRTVAGNRQTVVLLEDVVLVSQVRHLLPGALDSVVFVTSHALLPALVGTFGAETLAMRPLSPVHSRSLLSGLAGFAPDIASRREEIGRAHV